MEAVVGLGSNIDPGRNLPAAVRRLAARVEVVQASRAWRTPPVAVEGGPFLNAAVRVRTLLGQDGLARTLHGIEAALGRRPGTPQLARPIDLDLLLVRHAGDGWVLAQPGLASQPFHLLPLGDLLPSLRLGARTLQTWARRAQTGLPGARPVSLDLRPGGRPPRPVRTQRRRAPRAAADGSLREIRA
jgi:2-amino-4-hydroxy-6-hydroxymethyldihydropteridine diphosphokinase